MVHVSVVTPRSVTTHLIEPLVNVEHVHELAQCLVSFIGAPLPARVWMYVPDNLEHVNHAAQQVAQPVELLDEEQELPLRSLTRRRSWSMLAYSLHNQLCALYRRSSERQERIGGLEQRLAKDACAPCPSSAGCHGLVEGGLETQGFVVWGCADTRVLLLRGRLDRRLSRVSPARDKLAGTWQALPCFPRPS